MSAQINIIRFFAIFLWAVNCVLKMYFIKTESFNELMLKQLLWLFKLPITHYFPKAWLGIWLLNAKLFRR